MQGDPNPQSMPPETNLGIKPVRINDALLTLTNETLAPKSEALRGSTIVKGNREPRALRLAEFFSQEKALECLADTLLEAYFKQKEYERNIKT